ncbi:MAG: sulfatase [Akkermansiaceae bacterium]|nr:sulfatase [Akkermansiaceae bacterium]
MKIDSAVIAALWLALPSALSATPPPQAPPRPNILFLLGDDWAWPHASCLGTPGIKTPTFDRLAREGVLFRNAHAAAPSCSPSRAAMLTGQWPWRLGPAANLHGFIPATYPVYPDLLEQAGYWVGFCGKGYSPGTDQGRQHNAAGPEFKGFKEFLGARPATQPFCCWLGSFFPHRPYPRGSGVQGGIDPATVVVPPYLVDSAAVRSDICDYIFALEAFDRQAAEAIAVLENSGELDNTLIVIGGDNGWPFPRAKATCYDSGTHQPLAVRWGSRIKPGRVVDDFVSLADLAPTFLEAAGLTPPAAMSARSFLNVLLAEGSGQVDPTRDHVLTFMERHFIKARIDGGQPEVGYPMRTLLTHEFHYILNFKPQRWPAGDPPRGAPPDFELYAKRTNAGYADVDAGPAKAWILTHADDPAFARIFEKRPARELFDLRVDPFELHNVADDSAYAATLKELDARLMAELKSSGDPRLTGEELDRYPTVDTEPASPDRTTIPH